MTAIDGNLVLVGLVGGFAVGLTGMGGAALMTPILVLFFRVPPLAAVSSNLLASLIMRPIGGGVHLRRGTVDWTLVRWLCVGSVPAAFAGALVLHGLDAGVVDGVARRALGFAMLAAALSMCLKSVVDARRSTAPASGPVRVRPVPTVLIGAAGGAVVGLTSVGAGSLIIVLLLLLYPTMRSSHLVGTGLVQAVPVVAAATLGHLLFGTVRMPLTLSLLVGAIPGVYAGARLSSRAPDGVVRPALLTILVASGLKLVHLI